MKKLSFLTVMIAGLMAMQSCGDNSNKEAANSTTDSATTDMSHENTSMSDTANMSHAGTTASSLTDDDNQFVMKAASGGMMEVELGRLAQEKASSPRVKEFGAMMVTDHSKANDELKALAQSKGVTLPATMKDEHQKHVKEMGEKSGKDFDKDYMKMMVEDHKDDIDEFEKCSKNGKDGDVKAFATKTLPVLQKHLASAKSIHDAVK